MFCPRCQSNQCQRVEVAWQSERHIRELPGRHATGAHETVYVPSETITEVTALGNQLAPPKPADYRLHKVDSVIASAVIIIGSGTGALIGGFVEFKVNNGNVGDTAIGAILASIIGMWLAWRYLQMKPANWKAEYNVRLDFWRREWFCRQCGHRWIPESMESVPDHDLS